MIQQERQSTSQTVGVNSSKKFSIATNDKSFRILIGGLYSNPIRACLSELLQNGSDSHTKACNNQPLDISLPTRFDPVFEIRDYGVGMDDSFIQNEYTQAFTSTKDQSNDFQGCFGVGRLSALIISNNYNIVCYDNNEARTYCVSLDDGIPQINFIAKKESNEPRGVKISFSVPTEHISNFHKELPNVVKFYKVLPNVKNGQCEIKKPEYYLLHEENGEPSWGILKDQNEQFAVMGLYCYKVESSYLHFDSFYSSIATMPFVLHFKLGEVDVSVNRQSLSYTEKTKEAIKKKFEEIHNTFKAEIEKGFKNETSYYEACKKYKDLKEIKYKGLCDKLGIDGTIELNGRKVWSYFSFDRDDNKFIDIAFYTRKTGYYRYTKSFKKRNFDSSGISFNNDLEVLINDLGYSHNTLKRPTDICKLIKEQNPDTNSVIVISFKDEQEKNRIIKEYGLENVKLYSEYYNNLPQKQKKESVKYSKCLALMRNERYIVEIHIDLKNDSYIYIPVKYREPKSQIFRSHISNIVYFNQRAFSSPLEKIIFIKGSTKNAENNPNAIHFDDWVEENKKKYSYLQDYINKKYIEQECRRYHIYYKHGYLAQKFAYFLNNCGEKPDDPLGILNNSKLRDIFGFHPKVGMVPHREIQKDIESRLPINDCVSNIDEHFFQKLKKFKNNKKNKLTFCKKSVKLIKG